MSEQQHNKEELTRHAPGLPFPAPAMPHSVPDGYFEQLSTTVLERIRLESQELPDVLRSLKQKNAQAPGWPYQVPAGYFEQPTASPFTQGHQTAEYLDRSLQRQPITEKSNEELDRQTEEADQPSTAPRIALRKRSLFRYAAAAAVLTAILGVGRWYQQRAVPDIETDPASWVRNEVKKESTEKIERYIDGTLIETTDLSTDHKKEIAQLTEDIDEKEILNLLNETDLLASTAGESGGSQKILN
jgi:hypothetical protein